MKISPLSVTALSLLCGETSAFTVGNRNAVRWNNNVNVDIRVNVYVHQHANPRVSLMKLTAAADDDGDTVSPVPETEKDDSDKADANANVAADTDSAPAMETKSDAETEIVTETETETEEDPKMEDIVEEESKPEPEPEPAPVAVIEEDVEAEVVTETVSESVPEEESTTLTKTVIEEYDPSIPTMERLKGATVTSVLTNESVDLSSFLSSGDDKTMLILGTYAADFNAIEYVQRLRYYKTKLQQRGVKKIGLVLNCEADAAKVLVDMLDLKTDATSTDEDEDSDDDVMVELFIDPLGDAGKKFGVVRGWRPDDEEMSPYIKLFGMLWGLGAWATLPAVIGGYIGNPFYGQPWIEDALAVGQRKNRWPNTALELADGGKGDVLVNKFKELPYVGGWERRPLELATLRLQNMLDVSIKQWNDLAPNDAALNAGVLTQLGGCTVIDNKSGEELYRWRDPGICAVANFEDILKEI